MACADHYFSVGRSVRAFPHVWASLGAMAAATSRVRLQPAFANNLLRSPVELAQAVLMVHAQSGGRAEAGVGAGWSKVEVDAVGLPFPEGAVRARMLREAILIVRDLLQTGVCRFEGEHYRIDVPVLGPLTDPPPPIVASLGSPWTLRNITPLVDRVEVSVGRANRGGANDLAALGSVTVDEVRAMVDTVRDVAPDIPITFMTFAAAGTDEGVERMRALGDALYGSLVGEPRGGRRHDAVAGRDTRRRPPAGHGLDGGHVRRAGARALRSDRFATLRRVAGARRMFIESKQIYVNLT